MTRIEAEALQVARAHAAWLKAKEAVRHIPGAVLANEDGQDIFTPTHAFLEARRVLRNAARARLRALNKLVAEVLPCR